MQNICNMFDWEMIKPFEKEKREILGKLLKKRREKFFVKGVRALIDFFAERESVHWENKNKFWMC